MDINRTVFLFIYDFGIKIVLGTYLNDLKFFFFIFNPSTTSTKARLSLKVKFVWYW